MISEPFVRRPIATTLLALAILLSGLAAFRLLPVSPLPRVDFPTISVNASLPGASPETMASAVATPLERRFGRIAGLAEMTSQSSLGTTQITMQFDLDRNVDSAARDVQAAINAAGAELPPNLPTRPNFRKVNPADSPILILSLTSKTLSPGLIADAATTVLAQRISRIDGVGQVYVGGSQQPAVRVQVDPVALAGAGLTMEELRQTLQRSTSNSPKGAIDGDTQLQRVGANDQIFGADAFANLVVNASADGATVRLRDVARVIDSVENERVAAWSNGVRSVLIIVRRQPGANIVETNDRIRAVLPDLMKSVSPAIDVDIAVDRTHSIRASVAEIEHTLILSIVLVLLVVFVFLRSLRATAIPSVVVPLSLVGTFGVMYLLDYSVDNMSLMALTIATGFVVDDAIVVTENIARLIEEGKKPFEAALLGARQIGFTILSITTSLLAVFLPILLMRGVVGRLFREFAVTLSIAIVLSMVISLTLTPMMCARLLRPAHEETQNWFSRITERGFDAVQRAYGAMLRVVLRHRIITLGITIATVVATVALYYVVPKGLFPQQDVGMIMGFSEAPQDVSFPTMVQRQLRADALLRTDPDVAHVVSFVGGGPGGATVNTGSVFIDLKPVRKASAGEIIARLRPKLAQIEGIAVYMQPVQDVRVGGRSTRTQYQYTLEDADLSLLRTWTPRVLAKLKTLRELKDVASDLQMNGLDLDLRLARDDASRLGITARALDDTLYDAFGQRQVAVTYGVMNQYRVVLEMMPELVTGPESIRRLFVRSPTTGGIVPIENMVTSKIAPTPLTINHQGQFPSTTISFNLTEGASLGDAVDAVRAAEREIGLPGTMRAEFSGTAQEFQASLKSEPWLILAALVTIYIVLGMLYESLIHPITIISTLPSAGVGALISLAVFKFDLTIIALIGILLLLGIVKKNAIMMVDFAIEAERVERLSPAAAIEKACLLRFRPIMMTTLAALLAAVALVVSRGVGSELRQPLGVAIVGGLLVSQVLTLFTTPVVYLALERFSRNTRSRETSAPEPAAMM